MKLRFVGKNGSMGLVHGKVYDVTIETKYSHIVVSWCGNFCPYSTITSLADNWVDV